MTPNEEHAIRLVTDKCLIAADVDRTILAQSDNREKERMIFFQQVAPQLIKAARQGAHIAFITGNSMHELCYRILRFLVEGLCTTGELERITHYHFFCNSGGIYFHFPKDHVAIAIKNAKGKRIESLVNSFWHHFTTEQDGQISIRPQFIDPRYAQRCLIDPAHFEMIDRILSQSIEEYLASINQHLETHAHFYDLSWVRVKNQEGIRRPLIENRTVTYRESGKNSQATVQITIKPVLSFRQAFEQFQERVFRNDPRTKVVRSIQDSFDRAGLGQYVARPGGRGSVDVTLERLDKAYAIEFLIDHLHVEGNAHRDQLLGANTIYFGDEVFAGGGNDYSVTRIPGLFVFAVNSERKFIPFLRDVFVPSAIFDGPEATAQVLEDFNRCAQRLIREFQEGQPIKTAIEALKEEIFSRRVTEKIEHLKNSGTRVDDWQTLHTFVTLIARDKEGSKQWLAVLAKELDVIMTQMSSQPNSGIMPMASGFSHPDRGSKV